MRKLSALLLLLPLIFAGLPAGAFEPDGAPVQALEGSVAVPTRFTNPEQGFPGLGRRLWLVDSKTNGSAMYVFDVDERSWGGAFVLDNVEDLTGEADLGIYLYSDFGNMEVLAGGPVPVATAEYERRAAGGEIGFVPPGTTKAIVFTYNGVGSTFTYRAWRAPQVSLADGDLNVTVPNGGYVQWVNDTGDYAWVRRTQTPGAFDSGSGPANGLRHGETFTARFARTGTFAYETSQGSGTVTVVAGPGPGTPAN